MVPWVASSPSSISLCALPEGIIVNQLASAATRQSKITGRFTEIISSMASLPGSSWTFDTKLIQNSFLGRGDWQWTQNDHLTFRASYDTEPEWDFLFVEARTPGGDDWTTLPDANGHTTPDTGDSCPEGWVELHPHLAHYQTWDGEASCTAVGSSGSWNAAKDKGHMRLEGKEYVVQDGDCMSFRFNV